MKATVYWIEGPWPGRLAILPRPRGGDWLADEVRAWRAAGIELVVSALQEEEVNELDIAGEAVLSEAAGIRFVGFSITDRGVPASARETVALVRRLDERLSRGHSVAVHCRQGVGRSALLAACLLAGAGVEVDTAFQRIATARGCPVPDTDEQRDWVQRFVRQHLASVNKGTQR
jgi:protein-tyrosine phosphatase